jgi:MoaA/NifB/PqqE/SkfB family radical SAM enzyme
MSKSMYGPSPVFRAEGASVDWAAELAPFTKGKLKVIVDISNKCNLRCRMCHFSFDYIFYRPAQHMPPAMFARMAESLLPQAHTVILSAGNEPLVSPWFSDILKICADYHVANLLFLTNAQLLNERIAETILECGVTQVQVSADGATRETYEYIRRGACFERLLRNLRYLTARKHALGRTLPLLQFNIVLMQRNLEELEAFVDFAEAVGVEWIAARHLLAMHGLNMESESLSNDRERANHYFARFLRRIDQSKTVTVIEFPDFFDDYRMDRPTKAGGVSCDAADEAAPLSAAQPNRVTEQTTSMPEPPAAIPFGYVDQPAESETQANNAIQFSGWALDDEGISRVTIEREPFLSDPSDRHNVRGFIEIGEAKIVNGSRPDVVRAYPNHPHNYRAGWLHELRNESVRPEKRFRADIHVIAHNFSGRSAEIGWRTIWFSPDAAKPYLFCARPFDSIFIDSKGSVNPYPDCRPLKPFGSMSTGEMPIRDIWFGKEFRDLRQRIIDRDPPPMCLTCAHFINRNVDDPEYFIPRGSRQ